MFVGTQLSDFKHLNPSGLYNKFTDPYLCYKKIRREKDAHQ